MLNYFCLNRLFVFHFTKGCLSAGGYLVRRVCSGGADRWWCFSRRHVALNTLCGHMQTFTARFGRGSCCFSGWTELLGSQALLAVLPLVALCTDLHRQKSCAFLSFPWKSIGALPHTFGKSNFMLSRDPCHPAQCLCFVQQTGVLTRGW